MGHLSLEALVRTKDLKGGDQPDVGQDHTDQLHLRPPPGRVHRAPRGPRTAVSTAHVLGT